MEKIAVISLKGGVGKTTVSVNLAAGLANLGKKVLLVDLDSQNDLTQNLGAEPALVKGVEYLLTGDFLVEHLIRKYDDNLHYIPSGKGLKEIEISLSKNAKLIQDINSLLKMSLDELENLPMPYDYILVDCPNHPGILNINAMVYVDQVFIPVPCKHLGIRGAKRTAFFVYKNKTLYNKDLSISAIIPVMYDTRTKLSSLVYNEIQTSFERQAVRTRIHTNVSLAEAPAFGKTIFDYKAKSRGAIDFENLAREIIRRSFAQKEKFHHTGETTLALRFNEH